MLSVLKLGFPVDHPEKRVPVRVERELSGHEERERVNLRLSQVVLVMPANLAELKELDQDLRGWAASDSRGCRGV